MVTDTDRLTAGGEKVTDESIKSCCFFCRRLAVGRPILNLLVHLVQERRFGRFIATCRKQRALSKAVVKKQKKSQHKGIVKGTYLLLFLFLVDILAQSFLHL